MLYNVMCIDELGSTGFELSEMLKQLDVSVFNAKDRTTVINAVNEFRFSAIICVIDSETFKELDYIRDLKLMGECIGVPVIAISKYPDRKCILKAIESGVHEFIAKPYDGEVLKSKVCSALGIDQPIANNLLEYVIDEDIISFSFSEMFNKEVKAAGRGGYPVSIMLACITNLIDDKSNTFYSNEIVNNLHKVMKTKLRDTDTIFVYGKCGIAILLPFADKKGAGIVDEKIKHAFVSHTLLKDYNNEFKLITSIASFPEDGKIQQKLLERATNGLN